MNAIQMLRAANPYPEDVFSDKTAEQWTQFHKALEKSHLTAVGFMGCFGRLVWNDCIDKYEKILREEIGMQREKGVLKKNNEKTLSCLR
jgi:hypothetical protein